MSNYEGYTPGEIRICHDKHRPDFQWYAKVPLFPKDGDSLFRKFLAQTSPLEVELSGPELLQANPKIIAALKAKGISTTQLRIRPYTEKR